MKLIIQDNDITPLMRIYDRVIRIHHVVVREGSSDTPGLRIIQEELAAMERLMAQLDPTREPERDHGKTAGGVHAT